MIIARQSTARTVTVGPVLDADGVAVTDGVVGDFKISKNGGAPAALNASATLTHRNTGFYSLALTASDLGTVGQAEIVIDDTTNACPMKEITIVEEAVYDALFAASGTGALPVSSGGITTASFAAGAINAAAIANGAIDAATFAADVDAEILSYLVDDATRIDASALNTASGAVGSNGSGLTEAGGTGDHLTAINLPNQTMDITGNITGNLSGSVGSVTGAVGSVTGNVGGNVAGSVGSVTAGVTLAASAVQAIWDALTSALTAVGSIGKLLVDNINATISSRSSHTAANAATAVRSELGTELGRMDAAVSTRAAPGDEMDLIDAPNATAVTAIQNGLASQSSVNDIPTNAELATALAGADDAVLTAVAAVQTEVNKIPRVGESHVWSNDGSEATATVTITEPAP